MRRTVVVLAWAIGLFLIARAVAEPFMINLGDPATYEKDWGGPSLAGVLAVHMGPGVVAATLMVRSLRRRARQRGSGAGRSGP